MSRAKLLPLLAQWQKARSALGNKLDLHGFGQGRSQPVQDAAVADAKSTTAESPLTQILRSKGLLYLDVDPNKAFYWSHAGRSINFSTWGPWPENVPQSQGGFGARRTELVFIGTQYEEGAIRSLLDSCLYSDEEARALGLKA